MYRAHGGTRKGRRVAIWGTVVVSGEVDFKKMRRTKIKEDLKGFRGILRVRAMLCKRKKIAPFEHEAGHVF